MKIIDFGKWASKPRWSDLLYYGPQLGYLAVTGFRHWFSLFVIFNLGQELLVKRYGREGGYFLILKAVMFGVTGAVIVGLAWGQEGWKDLLEYLAPVYILMHIYRLRGEGGDVLYSRMLKEMSFGLGFSAMLLGLFNWYFLDLHNLVILGSFFLEGLLLECGRYERVWQRLGGLLAVWLWLLAGIGIRG